MPHRSGWALEPGHKRPNWVSSKTTLADHFMDPIPLKTKGPEAYASIKEFMTSKLKAKVERENYPWLHLTVQTPLLRFTDDVIIFIDEATNSIHFLSASRVGYRDFDANRNRINALKKQFQ